MAHELVIYAKPVGTVVALTLDSGQVVSAPTSTANGRDDAHVLPLPPGLTGQGAVLTAACEGRRTDSKRGIVAPSDSGGPAMFILDDFGELALDAEASQPPAPEPPDPEFSGDPADIIDTVYHAGEHDLATHDGCGLFTEDCCVALHDHDSELWGHIKKNPAQNQYNGHAVDALMLLAGEGCGIYDIIHDSVSPNATPAYNYKGPPDPELWYYPTGNVVLMAARPRGAQDLTP